MFHLLLLLQPRRAAGSLPEERRAVVRCLTHRHGAGQTRRTLPICHCQTRYGHFLSWQRLPVESLPVTARPLCCAVVRKLNELYKSSVASCRSLSARLERFFSRKHRLMDQISSITAERLLFSHTVQMVSVEPVQRSPVASRPRY